MTPCERFHTQLVDSTTTPPLPSPDSDTTAKLRVDYNTVSEGDKLRIRFKKLMLFEPNGAGLDSATQSEFEILARSLKGYSYQKIIIEGHSDTSGNAARNISLARARAQTGRAIFIEQGHDPKKVEAHGLGFSQPVQSNDTKEGRSANRRLEVVIVGGEHAK